MRCRRVVAVLVRVIDCVSFHQTIASAGSDWTCVTGSFVSLRSRSTRSARNHPDFVPGNVETMSSSVRSS